MGSIELELKGVVSDPVAVRRALLRAGAQTAFRGMLRDRRYDQAGRFAARDEVVRVRTRVRADGQVDAELGWKGPTGRSTEGYKRREERELHLGEGNPAGFLEAIGFAPVHAIDRYVETYVLGSAHARIEWYPRMDVLMEVEGSPEGIEGIIAVTGLPRASFTNEALDAFTARYDARHPGAPSQIARDGWQGPVP